MTSPVRHDRIDTRGAAILVMLCALWGMTQVAMKITGQEGIPPLLQAGLRSVGAAVLLCLWVRLRGGKGALGALLAPDGAFWPGMGIAVLFAGEFLFLFPGMLLTTASRGVLFVYTAPFWVAGGVHLLVPGERMTARQALGLLLAFAGIALAVSDGLSAGGGQWQGDALVLIGAAFWGLTTVALRSSPRLMALRPQKVLFYQLAGSAPLLLAAAALHDELPRIAAGSGLGWLWLGYQVGIVAFFSYLTWFWLIARYPAGRLSSFTFLAPLFGMLAGALVLDEHVSALLAGALVFVGCGIKLVNGPAPARRVVAVAEGTDVP